MRYLIVGFGNIGHKRKNVLGKKCVATVDPGSSSGADYKDSRDVPLSLFDAAVLTVPQQVKYELTEYFLSIGKHVLIEKPLIITHKQGKTLLNLAKRNKVIWHTSYNHRFEPNILKLKKLIRSNLIGKLYHARFVYSFGNINERIGTWRETEFGVLEEIAPHLIDFAMNFFNYKGADFKNLISRKIESKIYDYWVFATSDQKIIFETSSVTWKYQFSLDIFGKLGSLHINGLNKWGKSELIVRKRVFPSGAPSEKITFTTGQDLTWEKDFKFFEKMVSEKRTSFNCDTQMSLALAQICLAAGNC